MMSFENLKERFKRFGVEVIRWSWTIPDSGEWKILKNQLIRAATSTGANYRAACRAKSPADFINKMKIVEEEMDESTYWLEIISDLHPEKGAPLQKLLKEAAELLAITVSSIGTARKSANKP